MNGNKSGSKCQISSRKTNGSTANTSNQSNGALTLTPPHTPSNEMSSSHRKKEISESKIGTHPLINCCFR
jgi:hypothetical protein